MTLVEKILREARLNEIFDSNDTFEFDPDFDSGRKGGYAAYHVEFLDSDDNSILVELQEMDPGKFDVAFAFNGRIEKQEGSNVAYRDYIKILNTVAAIIRLFIERFEPEEIAFGGTNSKANVYEYIAKKIDIGYKIKRDNGLIRIIRSEGVMAEAHIPVENLFNGHDANRYAFIWRDVTKYNTIEKKRALAKKLEALRKKSGEGLPIEKLNPQLFVATQTTIDSNNLKKIAKNGDEIEELPFVVKLNGVYYLLDGHHRTSVALITQDNYVDARFLDLDAGEFA